MDLNGNKLAEVMREVGLGPGKCILCLSGLANMSSDLACFQLTPNRPHWIKQQNVYNKGIKIGS